MSRRGARSLAVGLGSGSLRGGASARREGEADRGRGGVAAGVRRQERLAVRLGERRREGACGGRLCAGGVVADARAGGGGFAVGAGGGGGGDLRCRLHCLRDLLHGRRALVGDEGLAEVDGREDGRGDGHVSLGHVGRGGAAGEAGAAGGRGAAGHRGHRDGARQDGARAVLGRLLVLDGPDALARQRLQIPQHLRPRAHGLVLLLLVSDAAAATRLGFGRRGAPCRRGAPASAPCRRGAPALLLLQGPDVGRGRLLLLRRRSLVRGFCERRLGPGGRLGGGGGVVVPLRLGARRGLGAGLGVHHGRLMLGRGAAEGDLVQHGDWNPALQRRLEEKRENEGLRVGGRASIRVSSRLSRGDGIYGSGMVSWHL